MEKDAVSASQVQSLLKLFAAEAKKEVKTAAEAAGNGVYTVLAAKDASVNDLERSAEMLQGEKDDALLMVKRQKTSPSNIFSVEKAFDSRRPVTRR